MKDREDNDSHKERERDMDREQDTKKVERETREKIDERGGENQSR